MANETALIVGAGSGLSAALALAARDTGKLAAVAAETGARVYRCDAGDEASVTALFRALDGDLGTPTLAVYNASYRARGPFAELVPGEVEKSLRVTAYGGFLVARESAQRMLGAGKGSIFFTGASASVKGYAQSAPFAMGKFALRGLAQSMALKLAPKNIHVAHFVIDGGIRAGAADQRGERGEDGFLDPLAIAENYMHVYRQHRSAWTWGSGAEALDREVLTRPFSPGRPRPIPTRPSAPDRSPPSGSGTGRCRRASPWRSWARRPPAWPAPADGCPRFRSSP